MSGEFLTQEELMDWLETKHRPKLERVLLEMGIPYIWTAKGNIVTTRTAVNRALSGENGKVEAV